MSEPLVSIIMGSQSDWSTMQAATTVYQSWRFPLNPASCQHIERRLDWWSLLRVPLHVALK